MAAAVTTLLTISDITREALAVLHESLTLSKKAVRKYESAFGNKGGQIGISRKIRKPAKFAIGSTADVTALASVTEEDSVEIICNTRKNVKLAFSTLDLSTSINDFSKQFLRPAMARLAREIDLAGFSMLKTCAQSRIGRTVTGAVTFSDYVTMNAIMTANLCPEDGRTIYAGSLDHAKIVDANKGLFQSASQITEQYLKGYMGTSGGFDWVSTENVPAITWTAAAPAAGTLSAGAAEGDVILAVTGMGANAIVQAGQAFTVAGVYRIDPETLTATNELFTFVAIKNVTLSAAGAGNITVGGDISGSGTTAVHSYGTVIRTIAESLTLATVSALPGNGAVITPVEAGVVASKSGKLIFGVQDDAVALATIDLALPPDAKAAQESYEGITIRMWQFSDGNLDTITTRCDVQFGWAVLRNEYISSTLGLVK